MSEVKQQITEPKIYAAIAGVIADCGASEKIR